MTRLVLFTVCLLGAGPFLIAQPANQPAPAKGLAQASCQIRNKKFGGLLRPEEARNANGTPIVLYPAQPWKCMTWKFHPAGEESFQLQNHFTSKTFAVGPKSDAAESNLVQVPWEKDSGKRPSWQFHRLADGTYRIADAQTGKALTAVKETNGGEFRIKLETWADKPEQQWELQEIDPKQLTM